MNVEQLEQHLDRLRETLTELSDVQEKKSMSLATMDVQSMHDLVEREQQLSARLGELSSRRKELVAAAGTPKNDFRELLSSLPAPVGRELIERFDRARELAKQVKQTAAENWFAAYRTNQHVGEMVELIANAGQPEDEAGGHGLFLDSTA